MKVQLPGAQEGNERFCTVVSAFSGNGTTRAPSCEGFELQEIEPQSVSNLSF